MDIDCTFPNYSPSYAYRKGCRCERCFADSSATKRRYYKANRERLLEAVKRRYDPKAKREYDRAYREKNRARLNALHRERARASNGPKARARIRAANQQKRGGSSGGDEARAYFLILESDPCSYCNGSMEHADHIDALARGGSTSWSNLTASCGRCNDSKGTKPLLTFLLAH